MVPTATERFWWAYASRLPYAVWSLHPSTGSLTRALVKPCVHAESKGTTWPHLLGVPPFCIHIHCCYLLSSLYNERNYFRGQWNYMAPKKAKTNAAKWALLRFSSGLILLGLAHIFNRLSYLFSQSIADWKQQIRKRERYCHRQEKWK